MAFFPPRSRSRAPRSWAPWPSASPPSTPWPPTDPAYRLADDESSRARLADAVATLRRLEATGADSSAWVTRFRRWPRLDPAERDVLLAELRGFAQAKL